MNVRRHSPSRRGSVLILVLWIAFGLVVLAIYFANSMSLELRAAQNRVATITAEHATTGAARYVGYILTNYGTNGIMPNLAQDLPEFRTEAVSVGEAYFWLLGRSDRQTRPERPVFGLIDEASKLNLNTATVAMLEALPGMTAELAAAIIDWRDEDSDPTENGAEDEIYARLNPPRRAKNAPFETVEELRLVHGATLEILYGEDTNLNGTLDPNENDGDNSPPYDNRDGRLDPGILEYVTVYSRQPNTRADGSARVNISTAQGRQQLPEVLGEILGEDRAQEIVGQAGGGNFPSVLQFYAASGMTADEFALVHTDLTASNNPPEGLVNVNTASEAVLACLPGIGLDNAPALVAFRQANPGRLDSMAWVTEVLEPDAIAQCGRFLTDQAYQFTADVAAVGPNGRGFHRTRFVFDNSDGTPRIIFRRDLTALGWALSPWVREELQLARENQR
jgi:DNA uptake protein ComE-like DNA-binding protein